MPKQTKGENSLTKEDTDQGEHSPQFREAFFEWLGDECENTPEMLEQFISEILAGGASSPPKED